MIILTIRTDKPEAEIGLFDDDKKLAYEKWHGHHHLSSTIHFKIEDVLQKADKTWHDIQAVICYKGPGSFTGLRIGLTVGNVLTAVLDVPIVSTNGQDWLKEGTKRLQNDENERIALPEYGSNPHITTQKK